MHGLGFCLVLGCKFAGGVPGSQSCCVCLGGVAVLSVSITNFMSYSVLYYIWSVPKSTGDSTVFQIAQVSGFL